MCAILGFTYSMVLCCSGGLATEHSISLMEFAVGVS